jgi:hypothetical protein
LALSSSDKQLISTDEEGYIRFWDISKFMSTLMQIDNKNKSYFEVPEKLKHISSFDSTKLDFLNKEKILLNLNSLNINQTQGPLSRLNSDLQKIAQIQNALDENGNFTGKFGETVKTLAEWFLGIPEDKIRLHQFEDGSDLYIAAGRSVYISKTRDGNITSVSASRHEASRTYLNIDLAKFSDKVKVVTGVSDIPNFTKGAKGINLAVREIYLRGQRDHSEIKHKVVAEWEMITLEDLKGSLEVLRRESAKQHGINPEEVPSEQWEEFGFQFNQALRLQFLDRLSNPDSFVVADVKGYYWEDDIAFLRTYWLDPFETNRTISISILTDNQRKLKGFEFEGDGGDGGVRNTVVFSPGNILPVEKPSENKVDPNAATAFVFQSWGSAKFATDYGYFFPFGVKRLENINLYSFIPREVRDSILALYGPID